MAEIWNTLQASFAPSLQTVLDAARDVLVALHHTRVAAASASLAPRQLESLRASLDNAERAYPSDWADRSSLESFAAASARLQSQLQRLPQCARAIQLSVGRLRHANEVSLTTLRMQQIRRKIGPYLAEFCSAVPPTASNESTVATSELESRLVRTRAEVDARRQAPMIDQCAHLESECEQLAALLGTLVMPFLKLSQELKAGRATVTGTTATGREAPRHVRSGAETLVAGFQACSCKEESEPLETALGRALSQRLGGGSDRAPTALEFGRSLAGPSCPRISHHFNNRMFCTSTSLLRSHAFRNPKRRSGLTP